jgi:hypothetical protein
LRIKSTAQAEVNEIVLPPKIGNLRLQQFSMQTSDSHLFLGELYRKVLKDFLIEERRASEKFVQNKLAGFNSQSLVKRFGS